LVRLDHDMTGYLKIGLSKSRFVQLGHVRSGYVLLEQDIIGYFRSILDRTC